MTKGKKRFGIENLTNGFKFQIYANKVIHQDPYTVRIYGCSESAKNRINNSIKNGYFLVMARKRTQILGAE